MSGKTFWKWVSGWGKQSEKERFSRDIKTNWENQVFLCCRNPSGSFFPSINSRFSLTSSLSSFYLHRKLILFETYSSILFFESSHWNWDVEDDSMQRPHPFHGHFSTNSPWIFDAEKTEKNEKSLKMKKMLRKLRFSRDFWTQKKWSDTLGIFFFFKEDRIFL